MNRTIFSKSSIEKVASPEQLNDYIKVSRPGIWLVLGTVVVLLIGVCVWGVYGTLTTKQDAVTVVQGGAATCYVTPEEAKSLAQGMEVQIEDSTGTIESVASVPTQITSDFDAYALYLSGRKEGDWMIPVKVAVSAPDGVYMAQIVLETIAPVFFVLN